jgi:hypothetical protein
LVKYQKAGLQQQVIHNHPGCICLILELLDLFFCVLWPDKVEKNLKGSLDLILSPSVKIQIMGRKVCLRCKGKTLLGIVNKFLRNKKIVDITHQCFALLPQVNFTANNLNFH